MLTTKILTVVSWLVPGVVAFGLLGGLLAQAVYPGGHPPLSAYLIGPTILFALILSPVALVTSIACVMRTPPGTRERYRIGAALLLNLVIFVSSLTIWIKYA